MVSVIVPVYGVEKYIARCAKSILSQSLNDLEIIFVNDCTKDNSMSILTKIIDDFPNRNIIIINKTRNEGLPQARRTGYNVSNGEYVIFFDSDDWVETDCIEKMYKVAKKKSSDIVIADYFENYSSSEKIIHTMHFKNSREGIDMMLRAKLHSGVWNKLIKRSLITNITFPYANMHEDLALMIQIFYYANKISFINEPFYHYNLTNNNSLTQKRTLKKTQDAFINLKQIEQFLIEKDIMKIHDRAFSNFVNTFKGDMMLHKQIRNVKWLTDLYFPASKYVFSENRLSYIKRLLLYFAYHKIWFPFKIIDLLFSKS